ncbi:MAG TPA: hypothetical protein VM846_16935 [Vicinamibacterales bacterium]|jgi:hypothetical protein|nr:hypothetical protein [Vicinamibacterales bacterium]
MKRFYSTSVSALACSIGMAAFAHWTLQAQAANTSAQKVAPEQVTVSGCIQRETDYRRARDAGRGGVAGTGLGAGNEFVLMNTAMIPASAPAGGAAAGTSGAGMAYELTGANEKQASQFIGQRVEISGTLKAAEVTASGRATGGATAGKPPEGIDVAGQDLKLRELEVTSIKKTSGTCPAP